MSIREIFENLLADGQTKTLLEFIQRIKDSIPKEQRIGKGLVWSLRQVRKQVRIEVPLLIQQQSLSILINSNDWQIRKLTSFIAVNCFIEENKIDPYLPLIKRAANDPHFGVRESAQMAMRELLQEFPDKILSYYEQWIDDSKENIRRCVSESLRPVLVNGKNWLRNNPQKAIQLLTKLNQDPSIYVRKSVGNNLADISKRHPILVLSTLHIWLSENNYDKRTMFIARKACRHIINTHPAEVTELLKGESIIN
ncbi:MAG: DNA alkylation repair protein [Candidatus Hermodarchaeota archaeon]